jgi:hypothetical protein
MIQSAVDSASDLRWDFCNVLAGGQMVVGSAWCCVQTGGSLLILHSVYIKCVQTNEDAAPTDCTLQCREIYDENYVCGNTRQRVPVRRKEVQSHE